jgi:SAM-dependent methyltransferase
VVPLFAEAGSGGIDDLFESGIAEQCRRCAPRRARLVSLGAGNGEYELPLAARLAQLGLTNLELVLLELNPAMLDRALDVAQQLGLSDRVRAEQTDLNTWTAHESADVYLAVHSLHHVVELEHLYDEIARSIDPQGVLLVNDLIGRNGHVRWPEAGEFVRRIWATLPERYRYSHYIGQVDAVYPDIDCSHVGFEGIRAQDVLPLLLERFHPEVFVPFGNVTDPFVDRVYGPNFDPESPEDTFLIDAIATLDDAGLDLGVLTPTHLIASFRARPVQCRYPRRRSPEAMVHAPLPAPGAPEAPEATADAPGALGDSPEIQALEARVAAEAAQYAALRSRKAVRAALAVAEGRHTVRRFLQSRGSR